MTNPSEVKVATIILAGGKGTRLYPLTMCHSKPAVSFGGRYRLIDIPISNSLNSNIKDIYVLGQYLTEELKNHLEKTYISNRKIIDLSFLTPNDLPTSEKLWFEGTADAVRKTQDQILKKEVDYFLILSGDQLYNIDFHKMLNFAIEKNADLTIASIPIVESEAHRFGIMKIDEHSSIVDFVEKPKAKNLLEQYRFKDNSYLASMGIYIFKKEALINLLKEQGDDFGKELIPIQMKRGNTHAFIYEGYWEDIGTISSYYNANLALTCNVGLKTYDEKNPIYSKINHLPGTKIKNTMLSKSIICEGGEILAKEIKTSLIGPRMKIAQKTIIENSIIMGNDHYDDVDFHIKENCLIKKAIIDEHVTIGSNVKLINKRKLMKYDSDKLFVRDGIIIVTANSKIPDNFQF